MDAIFLALLIHIMSNLILPTANHNKLWSVKYTATGSQLHHQYRITNENEMRSDANLHNE